MTRHKLLRSICDKAEVYLEDSAIKKLEEQLDELHASITIPEITHRTRHDSKDTIYDIRCHVYGKEHKVVGKSVELAYLVRSYASDALVQGIHCTNICLSQVVFDGVMPIPYAFKNKDATEVIHDMVMKYYDEHCHMPKKISIGRPVFFKLLQELKTSEYIGTCDMNNGVPIIYGCPIKVNHADDTWSVDMY